MTGPDGRALALADAYRDYFQLAVDQTGPGPVDPSTVAEALALIREAERQCPDPDAVYAEARTEWEAVMGRDAVLGTPLTRRVRAVAPPVAAPDPQGRLL